VSDDDDDYDRALNAIENHKVTQQMAEDKAADKAAADKAAADKAAAEKAAAEKADAKKAATPKNAAAKAKADAKKAKKAKMEPTMAMESALAQITDGCARSINLEFQGSSVNLQGIADQMFNDYANVFVESLFQQPEFPMLELECTKDKILEKKEVAIIMPTRGLHISKGQLKWKKMFTFKVDTLVVDIQAAEWDHIHEKRTVEQLLEKIRNLIILAYHRIYDVSFSYDDILRSSYTPIGLQEDIVSDQDHKTSTDRFLKCIIIRYYNTDRMSDKIRAKMEPPPPVTPFIPRKKD